MSPTTLGIVVCIAAAGYFWYCRKVLRAAWRKGEKFAAEYKSFSRDDLRYPMRVVVVGDDVAVGVGGTKQESIAALLSDHLHASIENYGIMNALTKDVADQAAKAWRAHYDLAVVLVGMNDISTFTWGSISSAATALDAFLPKLGKKFDHVLVCTGGDAGRMPAYALWPTSLFMSWRAHRLRRAFKKVCARQGVAYVDIMAAPDIFHNDKKRYYTADKMHVTGAAYEYWFGFIKEELERWPDLRRYHSRSLEVE